MISTLSIKLLPDVRFQVHCEDLLRQNAASITNLEIPAGGPSPLAFPFDAIPSPTGSQVTSQLSVLKIHGVQMARDGFSLLLKMSPALTTLDMAETALLNAPSSELYQHKGPTNLRAPFGQVFGLNPDATSSTDPSILVHFPGLKTLHTWCEGASSVFRYGDMKSMVAQSCPLLNDVTLEAPAVVSASLLTKTFESLSTIRVDEMPSSAIMGILAHRKTLTIVSMPVPMDYYSRDKVHKLRPQPSVSAWDLQMIPRTCARLAYLNIPLYEMDMDVI